ncbi:MAG TPA: F0F1 ATP synthase subunit B [Ignavibacteriaceae bacterium]|nr:F0F1 ATP synthase subunit B [Ignavibacteriaceae bacterium]
MLKAYIAIIASEGGGSLVDVNPGLVVWTVITFLVLLFILKKIAWKPILTALNEREGAIRESLEKAEKAKEAAQKILEENQASLLKAEEESKKIIEQSRQYSQKLKDQMMKESKEQAQKIIEDATSQIEQKKNEAFSELKTKVAEIAIQAAEKVLKENLDKDSNKKLVDRYIEDITKN